MHENTLHTARRTRTRSRLAIGAVVGLALAVGAPLAASAHVEVDPGTATAGSTARLAFAFHHGCDGSPTTALVIDIPDGVGTATPVYQGGWTIERVLRDDETLARVTFTADAPIDNGLSAAVSIDATFDESTAGATLAFPVVQQCVGGSTAWTQIPEEGQNAEDLDAPAPVVVVGPVRQSAASSHGSSHDEAVGDAAAPEGAADAARDAGAGTDTDPVARWLGGAGLAAGVAALAVVLIRRRRPSGD